MNLNSRSSSQLVCGLMLTCCAALAIGCGGGDAAGPTGTASGKVTLKGEPLTQGTVNFVSPKEGVGASGKLQPDGTFTLDGPLPVGDYAVFMTFDIAPSQLNTPAADILKKVPMKYRSQSTSGLMAIVKEGSSTHEFDLK